MKLVRGNNNSSWSLRAWLVMKQAGISFEELVIQLGVSDTHERILEHSPTGKVPILFDGDLRIWDSLSICEYINELRPECQLWPADRSARAVARTLSAEMHSGFQALRTNLPVQFALTFPLPAKLGGFKPEVNADIDRILAIWSDCRTRWGSNGSFLFGQFTIADAMFAPVVSRFRTYHLPLTGLHQAYTETMWSLPAMQEWLVGAQREWE